ncbi:MAG: class I SAM-dependent methyltransferase [Capsulimonadales bacterium]|nr:class I SAM-dependent methyltransferase [Capsulimonadales bacterium]
MSDPVLRCFTGTFAPERRPPTPNLPLQAWDAADEYLLELAGQSVPPPGQLLIVNDSFGALALALHAYAPRSWGDSHLAFLALRDNLRRNGLETGNVMSVPSTETPDLVPKVVLWRVPKATAFLQEQVARLAAALRPETLVYVGGMEKHLPPTLRSFLEPLGPVDVLPGRKKARLFRVTPDPDLPSPTMPAETEYAVPEFGLTLTAGPNVYGRERLDPGSALLLSTFDSLPTARRIADLGCGNGLLGLAAKRRLPGAEVVLSDESYQAVAAAGANFVRNGFEPPARFLVSDLFDEYEGEPFDLILCNPPFHQGHTIGDMIAWRMFVESRKRLRPGGELRIVGNRHLGYHVKLKRLFGNVRTIAADPRFVVLTTRR